MTQLKTSMPGAAERIGPVAWGPVVYVVDEDVRARESMELLVDGEGWRTETFASPEDFSSRSRTTIPCCLLLDASPASLELQKQLAPRTDIPIIFITGHSDIPTTVRAMKAGAFDFLTKPLEVDVLRSVIRDAIERSSEMQSLRTCYASLSPREREVMRLVVSGLLNKQVAAELGNSEITVKAHRGQAMRKMNAASFADLVTMAARLGVRPVTAH